MTKINHKFYRVKDEAQILLSVETIYINNKIKNSKRTQVFSVIDILKSMYGTRGSTEKKNHIF